MDHISKSDTFHSLMFRCDKTRTVKKFTKKFNISKRFVSWRQTSELVNIFRRINDFQFFKWHLLYIFYGFVFLIFNSTFY